MSENTITDKIITSFPNITNLWYGNEINNINKLGNEKILKIGNALEGVMNNLDNKMSIDIPRLVVVGTQSSGKSSLLNSIISMNIMPTGKTMVTRVPLNIQLNQSSQSCKAEFGEYIEGKWNIKKTIYITHPTPHDDEINSIHKEIEIQTINKAGNSKNICTEQITLKIYSPTVPNLGLIDLPGIVMVACTDRGQPKNIKEQIRNMIGNYIKNDRSIILAVVPARTDIEADPALELIKEYDPKGNRTVGILTKIDLMNEGTDISDYLNNYNISKDLQFNYGYYAVKNKSSNEEELSVIDNIKNEKKYFLNHKVYKNINCQNRLGTYNLSSNLSQILVNNIKKNIPIILSEVQNNLKNINNDLLEIGDSLPENDEGKQSLLYKLISDFCNSIKKAINDRGYNINTGRILKEKLIEYRENIEKIKPFTNENYDDEFIQNMINNYFGIHMSYNILPIEVMESCLKSNPKDPYNMLIEPSLICVNSIKDVFHQLIETLLKKKSFERFQKLTKKINEIINDIIDKHTTITENKIKEHIAIEKNYIWTDDKIFLNNLQDLIKNSSLQKIENQNIRILLDNYFNTVKMSISNIIPKIIMYFSIKNIEDEIYNSLFNNISKNKISEILRENPSVNSKRNILIENKKKMINAIEILSGI